MVLSQDELLNLDKEISLYPQNFMVLDTEHVKYQSKLNFEQAIEILDLCNTVNIANKLYKKTNPKEIINGSILYQVIESLIANKPFNDQQLADYFNFHRQYQKFTFLMADFTDLDERHFFPKVDLHLLGLDLRLEKEISNETISDELYDEYTKLFGEMVDCKKEIPEFLKESQCLVENINERGLLETIE